ncbi:WD domain-containing protein, G-beta repeat-containing protein [Streptomyces sp. Ncost-T6T-2b]|nr:WD domain-containing protein, G-beta repeat-containing protein [Streptomyces sp. Ncost-T6T-2b]
MSQPDQGPRAVPRPAGTPGWPAEPPPVQSVQFSPRGSTLALFDGEVVRLWDLARGKLTHRLVGNHWNVRTLAFSPDGTQVATTSSDGVVHLWKTSAS